MPENQSLILTFVSQTWLQFDPATLPINDLPTTYTPLPTTVGVNGARPLQVTINQNPIADVAVCIMTLTGLTQLYLGILHRMV